MDDRMATIRSSVIRDMSEGVMAISHKGVIELTNSAVLEILGREESELLGSSFARCFFVDERNDDFTETVLDAVRNRKVRQERYVPYYIGDAEKQLRVVSSCLHDNGILKGVVLGISDVTELFELRDAMRATEEIRSLNIKLELRNKLLTETFGRYLSDDIVKEILDTPDGMKMGGVRRRVTVLMSDLRGFTMMCSRMEPEALVTMLNHYFEEMYTEISRFKGTIIEFLGDGMFILFGAPVESTSHALDAVACAIAMQNRMQAVNEWNAQRGFEPLSMGIGINTGDVICGNIGSEKRTKYGVMGQTVNLAGRIESFTTDGMILISSAVMEDVPCELEIESVLPYTVKGIHGELSLLNVTGIGGEYDMRMRDVKSVLTELSVPVRVKIHPLHGKAVDETELEGEILAVSDTRAEVRMIRPPSLYENLMIDAGFDLYAKAVKVSGDRTLLVFTAMGDGFHDWLTDITGTRREVI